MEENKKGFFVLTTIITAAAIAIIIVLSFLYYYYSVAPIPGSGLQDSTKSAAKKIETPEIPALSEFFPESQLENSTSVIFYIPPTYISSAILPGEIKEGKCLASSVAQPYRQDAWKCMSDNKIYDPCFTLQEGKVICQMNPLTDSDVFLISLAEPLPEPSVPKEIKGNWAWFVEFEDGVYCAPYTGPKPQVDAEEIYYGCKSNVRGQIIVILGELNKGEEWTGRRAVLTKENQKTIVQSAEELKIKAVWQ